MDPSRLGARGEESKGQDAKLRDAKRTLLRGIAGRLLDVGSGEVGFYTFMQNEKTLDVEMT